MRLLRSIGRLLLSLMIDMAFHPLGLLAVLALLGLHLWLGWSIGWFIGALLVWALLLRLRGWFIDSASRAATKRDVPPRPYKTVIPGRDVPGNEPDDVPRDT